MLLNRRRAIELLARTGLDALVCVLPKNVYYLSDHQSDWLFDLPWAACAILPRNPDIPATLIVHDVELTNLATSPSWMPELRVYMADVCGSAEPHYTIDQAATLTAEESSTVHLMKITAETAETSMLNALMRAIGDLSLDEAVLGFDDPRLQAEVSARAPLSQCRDALSVVQTIRAVKSPAELLLMRKAATINQLCLDSAVQALRPGVLWSAIARTYNRAAVEHDCRPFCLYVGAGRKSLGLRQNQEYPVMAGDQVCFDGMLTFERYFGDSQRTCVMGPPGEKLKRYWRAVSSAADECYSLMRPGVNTQELRNLAQSTVRRLGVNGFRHAFVHGLGLDHLEIPGSTRGFDGFTLEEGMVVNMDIEVCELGFGGVYFEESMHITSTGSERLYDTPRELFQVQA